MPDAAYGDIRGEIEAFLPEIAVWNKNDSEPGTPRRSRDTGGQMRGPAAANLWRLTQPEPQSPQSVVLATMEQFMRETPAGLKTELVALGEDDLGKRDLWMFAPLLAIVVALPLAIVTVLSASLWFAAHSADRYDVASFASRFETVYTR
jgi:hypothetical protein